MEVETLGDAFTHSWRVICLAIEGCGKRHEVHRCEFCKFLLSYANVDKIMQNFASICRRDTGY